MKWDFFLMAFKANAPILREKIWFTRRLFSMKSLNEVSRDIGSCLTFVLIECIDVFSYSFLNVFKKNQFVLYLYQVQPALKMCCRSQTDGLKAFIWKSASSKMWQSDEPVKNGRQPLSKVGIACEHIT